MSENSNTENLTIKRDEKNEKHHADIWHQLIFGLCYEETPISINFSLLIKSISIAYLKSWIIEI